MWISFKAFILSINILCHLFIQLLFHISHFLITFFFILRCRWYLLLAQLPILVVFIIFFLYWCCIFFIVSWATDFHSILCTLTLTHIWARFLFIICILYFRLRCIWARYGSTATSACRIKIRTRKLFIKSVVIHNFGIVFWIWIINILNFCSF